MAVSLCKISNLLNVLPNLTRNAWVMWLHIAIFFSYSMISLFQVFYDYKWRNNGDKHFGKPVLYLYATQAIFLIVVNIGMLYILLKFTAQPARPEIEDIILHKKVPLTVFLMNRHVFREMMIEREGSRNTEQDFRHSYLYPEVSIASSRISKMLNSMTFTNHDKSPQPPKRDTGAFKPVELLMSIDE